MPSQRFASIDRRAFLKSGTAVAAVVGVAAPFQALTARADDRRGDSGRGRERGCSPDYGPLAPVRDETTGLPTAAAPSSCTASRWTGRSSSSARTTSS